MVSASMTHVCCPPHLFTSKVILPLTFLSQVHSIIVCYKTFSLSATTSDALIYRPSYSSCFSPRAASHKDLIKTDAGNRISQHCICVCWAIGSSNWSLAADLTTYLSECVSLLLSYCLSRLSFSVGSVCYVLFQITLILSSCSAVSSHFCPSSLSNFLPLLLLLSLPSSFLFPCSLDARVDQMPVQGTLKSPHCSRHTHAHIHCNILVHN